MSETSSSTALTTADPQDAPAMPVLTRFLYARHAPIQSICALADCGNGISWNARPAEMGFMNTDLTLHVHRAPESDWLASDSVSHWHGTGIGMSQSVLQDTKGPVATALQTLVLHPPT